ncbi:hypothetical protein M758_UG147000 [Ceratodon purpureus]|nr:hypothetical protein M758_UG147000 [Ceratodon purpureus]
MAQGLGAEVDPPQGGEDASPARGEEELVATPLVKEKCLEGEVPTTTQARESPEENTQREEIHGRGAPTNEDSPVELPVALTAEEEDPYLLEFDPPILKEWCSISEPDVSPIAGATEEGEVARVEVAIPEEEPSHESGSSMEEGS